MASTINASTTSTSGLVYNADASGILQLQSNGVTGLTVGTGGVVTAANGIVMNTMTLGLPVTGEFEYDGGELYFTPLGTQRGLVPNMQYYRLENDRVGVASTDAQDIFGVGCTLSSGNVYKFEMLMSFTKTTGSTAHTISLGFEGTATYNNILYQSNGLNDSGGIPKVETTPNDAVVNSASLTTISVSFNATSQVQSYWISGTFSVNQGGTFIPRYKLSAAVGPYTMAPGSFICVYPIGAAGSNTSVGTWA
jgi:hypothetical protein